MEKITRENINMQYPRIVNNDLLDEKKFESEDLNDKYFNAMNLYKLFFETYLKEKLPLELIDNNLKKSDLKFVPIKEEDMDFYQITSTMGLTYIYLRNNLYIEKLSEEDIEFLLSKSEYDDEVKGFIERTYLSVINPYSDDENLIMFYGPETEKHLCHSKDVVLGIRYNEFEQGDVSDEEYQKKFLEQLRLIAQISSVVEIMSPNEFGSEVRCVQYNELSIMKKYNGNSK